MKLLYPDRSKKCQLHFPFQRPQGFTLIPAGTKINCRPRYKPDFKIRFPLYRFMSGGFDRHGFPQDGIFRDLEFQLIDQGVKMSLMRRPHQSLPAFGSEGKMQNIRNDADALSHFSTVPVNDEPVLTAQVFLLVFPELSPAAIPVMQDLLAPGHRIEQHPHHLLALTGIKFIYTSDIHLMLKTFGINLTFNDLNCRLR